MHLYEASYCHVGDKLATCQKALFACWVKDESVTLTICKCAQFKFEKKSKHGTMHLKPLGWHGKIQ
jgi:hypothetical protein